MRMFRGWIKMVTVLEVYTTEEQRCVVWAEGFNVKDIHKKCFLFTVVFTAKSG
jgi:hypothetical protein